jgi:arylsulfatase A-like enzyme/Tfp pilus assembly protein PilF
MIRSIFRFAAATFLLLALGLAFACGTPSRDDAPDGVLLVVIDALRADRVGVYGYDRAMTPTLDSLAAAGLRFDDAMTPVPVTLPAVGSLLTGLEPIRHGLRDNGWFTLDDEHLTLAERFRKAGYRTAAVVASSVLAADRGLDQGFESWDDDFSGPYPVFDDRLRPYADDFATTRRRADRVTDLARERLEAMEPHPWFLLVHYFDVHMEYDPPPEFAALHPDRPYDAELSFVDRELGRLLKSVGDDVLVVVVADHGESQGDHGEPQHGFLLYQPTLRVPFLVAGPGVPPGGVRTEPVSLVDVEPTVARACGLPAPTIARDGIALDWRTAAPTDRALYAETLRPLLSYGWSELRAIRRGPWKLIRGPYEELYRLADDPGEHDDRPDADLRAELGALLDVRTAGDDAEAILRGLGSADRAQSRELLASLGYVSGDPDPAAIDRPHPREALPDWTRLQEAKSRLRDAAVRLAEGDVAAAESLAAAVLRERPGMSEAIAFQGYLAEQRGDGPAAERAYRGALERDPANPSAREGLARRLRSVARGFLDAGEAAQALPALEELHRLDPEDAVTVYNLGLARESAGHDDEARESFQAFLRLSPDDPDADAVRLRLKTGHWPDGHWPDGAP